MAPKRIQALMATKIEAGKARAAGIRQLIVRMVKENPTWGQERIAAELWLKLGVEVSARTVARLLASRVRSEKWEEDQFTALAGIYTESYIRNHTQSCRSGVRNWVKDEMALSHRSCYPIICWCVMKSGYSREKISHLGQDLLAPARTQNHCGA
jgi:hypothetical protein